MGRAASWLRVLFGIKIKEKDRYSGHNSTTKPLKLTPGEAALLRSFYSKSDKDRNRHGIVVAAPTTSAADAPIVATQTVADVVLLTFQDRGSHNELAAVKIQRVFRGHLARRALRALKALVKIQALVRGFLVRKQVAATLRGIQTLIRVQASVRARANKSRRRIHKDHSFAPQFQARKSLEKFESPKTLEVDNGNRPKSRSRRTNSWMSTPSSESFRKDFSYIILTRVSIPKARSFQDQECHFLTSQSMPRLAISCLCHSPAKSICVESYLGVYGENPNYMARTKSSRPILRSFIAPRQRPKPCSDTKVSIHELMESRNSMRMQRSCSRVDEALNFKNVVMQKVGRSIDLVMKSVN